MNIILIAAECFPFAKSSGLGDLVFSLAKGIEKEGHNVKVFMPRYGSIDPSTFYIERLPVDFKVRFNNSNVQTMVFKGILPNSFVSVFFIESQSHFGNSKEIYLTKEEESQERNKFFSLAALEVILKLKLAPDVIHLFNSGTAHIANLLRSKNIEYINLNKAGLIFTIHGLQDFSGDFIRYTKDAIKLSDITTTASKTYAHELLSDIQNSILSGIDEDLYNPEIDSGIAQVYSKNYFSIGKKKCKEDLLELCGLEKNNSPLFGMVSRLTEERGIDILIDSLSILANLNLQLVILGKGEESYEQELVQACSKYKNIKVFCAFDHALSKKIYAGSDFFLHPSQYESSGTSILIAMKYGSIPVAHGTPATKEIIIDIVLEEANGIIFKNYTKEDLLEAISKARTYYKNKEKWPRIVKSAMSFDFASINAAKRYLDCYESIVTA